MVMLICQSKAACMAKAGCSVQFSSAEDDVYALGKAHKHFIVIS